MGEDSLARGGAGEEAQEAGFPSEATTAAATNDGHRAWVIRDALSKLDPARAAATRAVAVMTCPRAVRAWLKAWARVSESGIGA